MAKTKRKPSTEAEFDKQRLMDSPDWSKVREMITLLIECRDALPAITLTQAKLHGVDLSLADRIGDCLEPWEEKDGS